MKSRKRMTLSPSAPAEAAAGDEGGAPPSPEEISKRAYELYLARDREEGHALEDWLKAQEELSRHRA